MKLMYENEMEDIARKKEAEAERKAEAVELGMSESNA